MITYYIVTLGVIALLLDWFIYKSAVTPHNKRWLRWAYITQVIIADGLVILALVLYHKLTGVDSRRYMHGIMWAIYLFMLLIVPKMVYAIFLSIDLATGAVAKKRIAVFRHIGLGLAVLAFGAMLWGATEGRNRVVVRNVTIESEKIPEAFDGYRIALFGDTHIGNLPMNNRVLRRLAERINALEPDMVIQAGDLVNRDARELEQPIMDILSGIGSRDGVYSVYGNHDLGFYMDSRGGFTALQSVQLMQRKQEAMGWRLLDNESEFVYRNGDSIVISGVNYPDYGGHSGIETGLGGTDLVKTYENIGDSTFNILIAHTPKAWDEILAFGKSDLTLSGHVHAMQAKIRIGRWAWSPARWMYTRWSGLYTERDRHLYINDGIGYVMYPMRVGTNPELTLITLKRK